MHTSIFIFVPRKKKSHIKLVNEQKIPIRLLAAGGKHVSFFSVPSSSLGVSDPRCPISKYSANHLPTLKVCPTVATQSMN